MPSPASSREADLATLAALPAEARRRAEARRWLVQRASGALDPMTLAALCPPEHWPHLPRRGGRIALSRRSLRRWASAYAAHGLAGLADRFGNRNGASIIAGHPQLMSVVLGCLVRRPHIQARAIREYLTAAHPELPRVSEDTILRFVTRWKRENAQLWTFVSHPDKWKNVHMVAYGSQSESVVRLNQLWEMDATPADWMLTDGRHAVILTIDIFSRRLKALVAKTSKAAAVGLAFRRAVLDWGVPEGLRTDNGAEFVGSLMESVLHGLDAQHVVCIPFASEQKGHVERAVQTTLHGLLELLPGFLGHSVAERKVIEARKSFAARVMTEGEVIEAELTGAQLQAQLDRWCDVVYQHNGHSGLDGRTPFEVAAAWRGPVRRITDPAALDVLLLEPAGTRTVSKQGIRFERRDYIDTALTEWVGCAVRVRVDPADLGRILVLSEAGEYICWARSDLEGVSRQEAAAAAKHHQRKVLSEQKRELLAHKRAVAEDMVGAVMAYREERARSLTALPTREIEHTTPGLAVAAQALAGLQPKVDAPLSDAELALSRVIEADFGAPARRPRIETLRDDAAKYEHWCLLDREIQSGRPVDEDELRFHTAFRTRDYWRLARGQEEEFERLIEARKAG